MLQLYVPPGPCAVFAACGKIGRRLGSTAEHAKDAENPEQALDQPNVRIFFRKTIIAPPGGGRWCVWGLLGMPSTGHGSCWQDGRASMRAWPIVAQTF